MSVRYADGLHSAKSSVTLQRTDRHKIGTKSLRIFKGLCENGRQGVRRLAQQTGLSTSSVHRLKQAMACRDRHPESWGWDTEEGRSRLLRLVVATLYTFGLTRGVGVETISAFVARLRLETQVGCAPSACRGVMEALEAALVEALEACEQDGLAAGEVRESIGAVDETFLGGCPNNPEACPWDKALPPLAG